MSLESFYECIDDIDAYTELRSHGIIDPNLLWTEEEIDSVLTWKEDALKNIAMKVIEAIAKIEILLEDPDKIRARSQIKWLLDGIPWDDTTDTWNRIADYELGEGPVPATPDDDPLLVHRVLLEKVNGEMDISDVVEKLATVARDSGWVVSGKLDPRMSLADLLVAALCVRAGENIVTNENLLALGKNNTTLRRSVENLQGFFFRRGSWQVTGSYQEGIALRPKE